jgi:hypothetical protein
MQNPTPQAAPQPSSPFEFQPGHPTRPVTQREIQVIRNQRGEMSNQLQSAQDRRERLLNEIRTAPSGTEQGLLQQLQVLNDRIVRIEQDIEASGATLRTGQVPVGLTIVPPPSIPRTDGAERGAAISVFVVVVVSVVYAVRRWTRRGRRRTPAYSAERDERMERLEQAVDAIAIEVERVGESQRFQTKLLAEANIMPALNMAQRAAEPIRVPDYEEVRSRAPDR